jgi:hypothetical protein
MSEYEIQRDFGAAWIGGAVVGLLAVPGALDAAAVHRAGLGDPQGPRALADISRVRARVEQLRGDIALRDWAERLGWRPMVPGTFVRAPAGDRRHEAASFYIDGSGELASWPPG